LAEQPGGRASGGEIRTFLIADVRGYTEFTHEHGDDAAAALAGDFADLARSAVADYDGHVIELRGDEALAVFSSARQAIRAAVEIQRRTRSAPLPLGIGVGVDAGESVALEGGYRGGALNLASRLCGLAGPGQILVSETVVGLARKVDGVRFVKRRAARFKGLEEAVPVIEAVPDPPLPPLPARPKVRRHFIRRHRWLVLTAALGIVALAVTLPLTLTSGDVSGIPESVVSVPRSFIGLVEIDPATDQVLQRIRTPGPPSSAVLANGALWIGDPTGVEKVNPKTGQLLSHIPITGGVPGGIAGNSSDGLWIANPVVEPFALSKIDPYRETVTEQLRLPRRPTAGPYVGEGFVWLVVGANTIFKINPADGKVVDRIPYSFPRLNTANAAAAGGGAFWIADPHGLAPGAGLKFGVVVRIDAQSDRMLQLAVRNANEVAVSGGAVWAASGDVPTVGDVPGISGTNQVTEINPATGELIQTIGLPRTDGVVAGRAAVWVENGPSHTLVKLNPAAGHIVSRVVLPQTSEWFGEIGDSLLVGVYPPSGGG